MGYSHWKYRALAVATWLTSVNFSPSAIGSPLLPTVTWHVSTLYVWRILDWKTASMTKIILKTPRSVGPSGLPRAALDNVWILGSFENWLRVMIVIAQQCNCYCFYWSGNRHHSRLFAITKIHFWQTLITICYGKTHTWTRRSDYEKMMQE